MRQLRSPFAGDNHQCEGTDDFLGLGTQLLVPDVASTVGRHGDFGIVRFVNSCSTHMSRQHCLTHAFVYFV